MNNLWLIGFFVLLTSLALFLLVYPLRQSLNKRFALALGVVIVCLFSLYRQWGAWPQWQHFTKEQTKLREAKKLLREVRSPEELIDKLKAQLDNSSKSARGWYLLGRVYGSQNQWTLARDAFRKAHQLNPQDELSTINYANSLWELNQQKFNPNIRKLFSHVLHQNPNQPDALAMLAMDAYSRQDYPQAIMYWQHLLKLVPPSSEEAKALRRAIAKAQLH